LQHINRAFRLRSIELCRTSQLVRITNQPHKMYSIIAAAAVLATGALADSVGNAIIINSCSYEVYLADVPAAGGGYEEDDHTLQPGDKFTKTWTQLSNDQGWSMKLSKDTSFADIMQYEYTFHNDGIIWYDLSDVNGNPWDGNWEITAASDSSTCAPKQQAYRYATDDAYGMQACPQDSVITVTLCSGDESNDGGAASASSSVAAETSSLATATDASTFTTPSSAEPTPTSTEVASTEPASTEAPASTPTSSYVYTGPHRSHSFKQNNVAANTPSPTTLATVATSVVTPAAGVTVTEVDTAVVTEVVTAYGKRHEHHRYHGRA